jgi:hypothetical protein
LREKAVPTDDEIKAGLKAFKKRLKTMRLDDESNLSRAGGRKSGILGISPPGGHAPEVWEELVKRGRLKREMGGTYSLVEDCGRVN